MVELKEDYDSLFSQFLKSHCICNKKGLPVLAESPNNAVVELKKNYDSLFFAIPQIALYWQKKGLPGLAESPNHEVVESE